MTFAELSNNTKNTLYSIFFSEASKALVYIFINAFIWTKTNSSISLMLYNIGLFIGLV